MRRPAFQTRPRSRTLLSLLLTLGALAPLLLLSFFANGASIGAAPSVGVPAGPGAHFLAAAAPARGTAATDLPSAPAAVPLANTTFNPTCAKIDTTVCISIQSATEPNIIPPAGSFVSAVEPNASQDLHLIIKSRFLLNGSSPSKSGPNSPIALNVTGVLWNGVPYSTFLDGNVWHADNNTWWGGPTHVTQNQTYPYWYTVVIAAKASSGAANFFAGETVTWWIELTTNIANTTYTHHEGPHFQFTYGGAWPFSPYQGSQQYSGPNATFADVNVSVHPRSPNWNDTVQIVVNTTAADGFPVNASIGSASVQFRETYNSAVITSTSFPFPVNVTGGVGAVTTSVLIPAVYSQLAGAVVSYSINVADVAGDQLLTPAYTYTVGANGSFLSGTFTDDLGITSSPADVAAAAGVAVVLQPGQAVNVTVTSLNPGVAINAAELVESFSYPAINERIVVNIPMFRLTSTIFRGTLPGVPVGSFVNFTVDAWDFSQHQLVSPEFSYVTPSFAEYNPFVPGNETFFYVYIFDNGTHEWVSGATVQVTGPHGFLNSVSNTTYGISYPNATLAPFVPLLLPANESYHVSVRDPAFVPTGTAPPELLNATVVATHALSARQTLVSAPNYFVVQEGSSILFYLNGTPAPPVASPPATASGIPLPALIGLVATIATAVPLYFWWTQIRARRKEEEKRVTL
ncbi:MAG: hypothetical protein L3K01_02545 [Thermoplasmata archaeon]|nr:hypothetical protein [Thermoplasmata archaeon]